MQLSVQKKVFESHSSVTLPSGHQVPSERLSSLNSSVGRVQRYDIVSERRSLCVPHVYFVDLDKEAGRGVNGSGYANRVRRRDFAM